ncbi:substrate-binding periplasmic protein [Colwelliaceae bacterium 6441]
MYHKYLRFAFLAMIALSISCNTAFANVECENPLVLSSTIDWYPYIYIDSFGASTGVDINLLRIILKEMDCQLKVIHFPERRSLYELKKGNFDIWLGASLNEERSIDYWFSHQYRHEINKLAYRSNDIDIAASTNFYDIVNLNKIIALNLAGWYGDEIEKAKADHNNFVYSDTVKKRLKMLSFKRVDIVIDDSVVLCSELANLTKKDIEIHSLILYEAPIYFMFNKKNISHNFVVKFNKILDRMKKNNMIKQHYSDNLPISCQ